MTTLMGDLAFNFTQGGKYKIQSVMDGNFLQSGGTQANKPVTVAQNSDNKNQVWHADVDGPGYRLTVQDGSGLVLHNYAYTSVVVYNAISYASPQNWTVIHFGNGEVQLRTSSEEKTRILSNAGEGNQCPLAPNGTTGVSTKWRIVQIDIPITIIYD